MTIHTDDFAPTPPSRVVSAAPASPAEEAIERALRPKLLKEYVGQAKTREQLEIFIGAAARRCLPAWAAGAMWWGSSLRAPPAAPGPMATIFTGALTWLMRPCAPGWGVRLPTERRGGVT